MDEPGGIEASIRQGVKTRGTRRSRNLGKMRRNRPYRGIG
jgi:hypothetical protein